MSVKTAKKLESYTRTFIVEAIKDIISDPDFGFELTERAKRRLTIARTTTGKGKSFSEVRKKY
ncbi:MAG: hypothetical protein A3J54_01170 [Candidatus Ryanbacteria bacterium RIFCSPHIGHO2_02_FULL_45_13b]|uniref:Uncharacterized protein n=1 Tax=Candidatus Ryanbacteria bacterium RIFCSPHIGHO2_02_FULL_45_13b TaxID=1802117 RepID=A0A1G2G8P5_9BACT|nr:MAG: hypothetical protein A3J54_01170 [Candidatus Ryanbacteria bacterium RIFCSPHIGHO2_02_FULL_45_13b]